MFNFSLLKKKHIFYSNSFNNAFPHKYGQYKKTECKKLQVNLNIIYSRFAQIEFLQIKKMYDFFFYENKKNYHESNKFVIKNF